MSAHTADGPATVAVPPETLRVQVRIDIDGCPPILVDKNVTLTYHPDPDASAWRDDTHWSAEGGKTGPRTMYRRAGALSAWVSDQVDNAVYTAFHGVAHGALG